MLISSATAYQTGTTSAFVAAVTGPWENTRYGSCNRLLARPVNTGDELQRGDLSAKTQRLPSDLAS
jgi:hypothetical protein